MKRGVRLQSLASSATIPRPEGIDRHNIKSLNIRSDKEAEGGTWNRTRKGWLMRPLSGHCSLLPERALARVERHMRQSPCQGIDRHNNQQSRAHD